MIQIENLTSIGNRGRSRHTGGVYEVNNERRLGVIVAALGGN